MKKSYLLLLVMIAATGNIAYGANEVGCVCNNKEVKNPKCSMCGSESGTMEQTANGALCICENNLQSHRASCADACENDGGWSGEFSE